MTLSNTASKTPFLNLSAEQYAALKKQADELLSRMTLAEKIGQMSQFTSDRDVTGPSIREGYENDIRKGHVGSVFNAFDADFTRQLQQVAVEESRLGIPLLFGYDVVHGFRTIFPIPLGMASSWHPEVLEEAARIAAKEAASAGIHWVFAPMVDISRDARWGRVMEGCGEDPLLTSLYAKAQIRGLQGADIASPETVAACVKHYAGYAAAEAGRDYNTVNLSERAMRSIHLPPFQAAVNAGVASVMTSFNTVDGVPASCNPLLLDQILRREWQFDGLVVTDYTAIMELIFHGVAADPAEAAQKAVNAGVDMDMQDGYFLDHLEQLVNEHKVTAERIDEAVRRILILKAALGLFEDPYRYCDEAREKATILAPQHLEKARQIARESIVLLKNDGTLPLSESIGNVAVIGNLVEDKGEWIGPWHGAGRGDEVTSFKSALEKRFSSDNLHYSKGTAGEKASDTDNKQAREDAIQAAQQAELVILVVGEREYMSGEAASRTDIRLPEDQRLLAKEVLNTGTPTVMVTLSGRPLVLGDLVDSHEVLPPRALLHAWWPGTQGAPALVDLLFGDAEPSARLPMGFPRHVGQLPLYYAQLPTGRPLDKPDPDPRYSSQYIDSPNSPLFPFGYGLTYTRIEYGAPSLTSTELSLSSPENELTLTVNLTNTGKRKGIEIVQLYMRDPVASISRPRRELIDFKRIALSPGEDKEVRFQIKPEQLGYLDQHLQHRIDAGCIELFVGPNVEETQKVQFTLID